MKVKFVFDVHDYKYAENVVEIDDNSTEEDIMNMFPEVLGLTFDGEVCTYEVI